MTEHFANNSGPVPALLTAQEAIQLLRLDLSWDAASALKMLTTIVKPCRLTGGGKLYARSDILRLIERPPAPRRKAAAEAEADGPLWDGSGPEPAARRPGRPRNKRGKKTADG